MADFIASNGQSDPGVDLKTNGNVGIGTTDPNRNLHIESSGDAWLRLHSTGANGADFLIGTDASAPKALKIYDNDAAAYRLIIDANGNVGIGTTNPSEKLEIFKGRLSFVYEDAPTSLITLNQFISSGNLNGRYRYFYTHVTADGETAGGPMMEPPIPAVNQNIELNIPAAPAGVTARRLYRSKGNEFIQYFRVAEISGNSATTYVDSTADGSLPNTYLPGATNIAGVNHALNIISDQSLDISPVGNPRETSGGLSVQGTTVEDSKREFLATFGLISNRGSGISAGDHRGKVALYSATVGLNGTGDIWAMNPLISMESGSGNYCAQIIEADINNKVGDRSDITGNSWSIGINVTGNSLKDLRAQNDLWQCCAGLAVTGPHVGWKYGLLLHSSEIEYGIYQDPSTRSRNYLAGRTGIGTNNPTYLLHIQNITEFQNLAFTGSGLNDLWTVEGTYTGTTTTNYRVEIESVLHGSITAFANAGSGQVTVTSAAHGLSNGNSVTISNSTFYDGVYTVSNVTTNTFEITATWAATQIGFWERRNTFRWSDNGGSTWSATGVAIDTTNALNNGTVIHFASTTGHTAGNRWDFEAVVRDPLNVTTRTGTPILTALRDGTVGIGTTSPSFPLSFGTGLGNKIAIYDSGSGNGYGFGIQANLLQIFAGTSTDRVGIGYGNSGSFTETLTVKSGNVGIGTTNPGEKLEVNGNIKASGGLIINMPSATPPSNTVAGMLWYDSTNNILKIRNIANTGWNNVFTNS